MAEQQDNSADDQQSAGGAEQPAEAGTGAEQPVVSSEPTAPKKSGGQGTRIVVWTAVAIFAVVAIMEIRAKTDAEQTGNAWREQFFNIDPMTGAYGSDPKEGAGDADPKEGASDAVPKMAELRESHLQASIKGTPEVSEVKLSELATDDSRYPPRPDVARITRFVKTYSWKGLVQTYHVHVYLGLGEDRSVEDIVGPRGALIDFNYVDVNAKRAPEENVQNEEAPQESDGLHEEAAGSGSTSSNAE